MMNPPLVSVVIPFYNAEDCVVRCMDSVLEQEYENFEVICVDDGSTDDTFRKLQIYINDPRIKVFSVSNGGPGAARNYGVAKAQGEWIAFIDGDDLASPYYLENMVAAQRNTNADMVIGRELTLKDKAIGVPSSFSCSAESKIFERDEAIDEFLYERLTESPWGKLIRKIDIEAVPFPEGCWYEDVATAGRLYLRMSRVAVLDKPIYGYVMKEGSVTHKRTATLQQAYDLMRATNEMLNPIERVYPEKQNALIYRKMLEVARLHTLLGNVQPTTREVEKVSRTVRTDMQSLLALFETDARASRSQVLRFRLLAKNPRLYDVLFRFYERIVKGVRR